MNQTTQTLLAELYAADPSLKKYEPSLISIIERMVASRPNVKIDARFRNELKAKMLEAIAERDMAKAQQPSQRLVWALGSAILLIVVAVPVVYVLVNGTDQVATKRTSTFGALGVTKQLAANAFGSLSSDRLRLTQSGERGSGPANTAQDSVATGLKEDASTEPTIAPVPGDYSIPIYQYVGTPLALAGGDITVYKRDPGLTGVSGLNQLLQNVRTGLVDLSKLKNTNIQSLSFAEERDLGYQIYLDFIDGSVSVQQNWQRWPTTDLKRAPTAGGNRLNDDQAIEIANRWLSDYGVNRSAFGTPVVQTDYLYGAVIGQSVGNVAEVQVGSADAVATDMMPYQYENMNVIYPLVIDGKKVYDLSGQPYGLNVQVSASGQRVSGVSNLRSLNLSASDYATISDTKRVLDIVKRGGVYSSPIDASTPTSEFEVGEPESVLTVMQTYTDTTSSEFYVPALRFPITKTPVDQPTYQSAIVVPLVSDFLDTVSGVDDIKILPIDASGANVNGSTGSGSAEVETTLIEPVETPTLIINANSNN